MNTLKWLLPRLPLPMLALAASYGVYQFALLFVPWWVALIQAAAFETTYLGLALVESETQDQRRRATAISIGAVVVSVLYNSLAGFFHRNGLGELSFFGEVVLATLHGAPLAIVAYLVADLLLHKSTQGQPAAAITVLAGTPAEQPVAPSEPALDDLLSAMGKTRDQALDMLRRGGYMTTDPKFLYLAFKRHGISLPDTLTKERFAVLLAELKAGEAADIPFSAVPEDENEEPEEVEEPTLEPEPVSTLPDWLVSTALQPYPAKLPKGELKNAALSALDALYHPGISDNELRLRLYAIFPHEQPSSLRVYLSEFKGRAAVAVAGSNGHG